MNPVKQLSSREKLLWILSLIVVMITNIWSDVLSDHFHILTLVAAFIGVTAVLFCAKGNIWGQILIAIFSICYGIISWEFRYYGEMATYLGMAFPMAIWSIYTWVKHPFDEETKEVSIRRLTRGMIGVLSIVTVMVTILFYELLKYLHTPNLLFSTISVTTSFLAAALTMLRSSYYAFWYALNDLVLIVLWVFASFTDVSYIPVVVNFVVFFINDVFGFYSWKKRQIKQQQSID